MRIVGVSFDPPEKNQKFVEKEGFRFELWTDADRELAMAFGAAQSPDASAAARVTVVLDAQGRQVLDYRKFVNMGAHPGYVLDDCKKLFRGVE